MEVKKIITKDGSCSLYVPELDETYHSTNGAYQEAIHIFIQRGLEYIVDSKDINTVRIFEAGFGTGLNAFLTYKRAKELDLSIEYYCIEAFPLQEDVIMNLNYHELGSCSEYKSILEDLHHAKWGELVSIDNNFSIYKIKSDLSDPCVDDIKFDLIYFDAFGPDVQPELWTEDVFRKYYDILLDKGCLITYSVKGIVKRALKKVGFGISKLPGPPGKREICRADKG
ncbi:MAG: tRNA (5-methylaminomethyl-2-thiouridine)(34)-methyltransferase MnmD [Hyphomicrobiales bacterium]